MSRHTDKVTNVNAAVGIVLRTADRIAVVKALHALWDQGWAAGYATAKRTGKPLRTKQHSPAEVESMRAELFAPLGAGEKPIR